MNALRDLLVEIGTEELPPKALKRLSDAFRDGIEQGLEKADLAFGEVKSYATPRRLAVLVRNVALRQPDKLVERRGPAMTAAFDDDGVPTKAALGFAKSCGVEMDELEKLETDKGAWLVFKTEHKGEAAAALIPAIVNEALDKLPIPKRMRWGALRSEFVRPVHWVVLLFGDEVIDTEILSVRSGRETRGHRFHHPHAMYLGEPAAYGPLLESEGKVIADFAERREAIRAQVLEIAHKVRGRAVIDEDLLDEVTGLVEWPVAVLGNFEERFLEIPAEALVSAMKGHQKYFHVVDEDGMLLPHFITVSNIESRSPEHVQGGNERVIRPRLTDADFFWNKDRSRPLSARLESLKAVVFQKKLGSLYDKTQRAKALAGVIAPALRADQAQAERAAELGKCDLMTEMVGEFPELQGIMGRYYATHDGESAEVAAALDEQYKPRFAGDSLPESTTGRIVAIADKLDTLVGIFGIGQLPTGDKDPFALRRAALGVLRIMMEAGLDLDLAELLESAAARFEADGISLAKGVTEQVFDFMMERLRNLYHEAGVAADTFEAVLARRPPRPLDFDKRIKAVTAFRQLPEAESLAAANKRIHNILKKAEGTIPEKADPAVLREEKELALFERVEALASEIQPLFRQREYEQALKRLAVLKEPVDEFFNDVMVMTEEVDLRSNRLALLNSLGSLFLEIADLSKLQG